MKKMSEIVLAKINVKQCYSCKQEKKLKDFHINIRKSDGLSYMCKVCWSKYIKNWRTELKNLKNESIRICDRSVKKQL